MAGLVTIAAFNATRYAAFVSGLNVTRTAGIGLAAEASSPRSSSRPGSFIKYLGTECRAKVLPGASLRVHPFSLPFI